jgi:hypothetical protein
MLMNVKKVMTIYLNNKKKKVTIQLQIFRKTQKILGYFFA